MSKDIRQLAQRKLNFFQTLKAVMWGFFGVRKGAGYQEDIAKLNPVHLVIAALVVTALFVVGLIMIAKLFIAQAI